ncbi:hypothetical protein E2C01_029935 [Portunus trituberculatus]|uniref:Uncharacterized protein n=1 Tax=Portunus trituberculatus TaxID=210409 RepID=A0A5B7ETJ6_PORTR|nr:hypothetical protein [Portunus trituberculatus]
MYRVTACRSATKTGMPTILQPQDLCYILLLPACIHTLRTPRKAQPPDLESAPERDQHHHGLTFTLEDEAKPSLRHLLPFVAVRLSSCAQFRRVAHRHADNIGHNKQAKCI